jgi:hypothetical protein
MADEVDSPLAATRADSRAPDRIYSRDVGRDASLFQGPGESPDISGDGRGVTSAIEFSLGEDIAELCADPILEVELMLVPKACLTLGVREGSLVFDGLSWVSVFTREVETLLSVAEVTEYPGTMSVCRRSPALIGDALVSDMFARPELDEVSNAEIFVEDCGFNGAIFGGQEESWEKLGKETFCSKFLLDGNSISGETDDPSLFVFTFSLAFDMDDWGWNISIAWW